MTRKGIVAIIIFALIVATFLGVGSSFAREPVIGAIVGLVFGGIISIGTLLFRPFRDWLETFVNLNMRPYSKKCRVLLIGLGRSGKTSIIRQVLTEDTLRQEVSTDKFDIFEEVKRVGLKNPTRYIISIADYTGQKLSQITVHHPEKFFGTSGHRLINALIFVVDLFPELNDPQGKSLKDHEIIEEYNKENAHRKITERVAQHKEYITKFTVEQIFEVTHSDNQLFTVRLLINKADLLRDIFSKGYLSETNETKIDDYAKEQYASLINSIESACKKNNIDNFSVHLAD